ncbi:MAG: hypothetical protein MK554_14500 [Planctomycetes bacterium]|nr:hypothetical protein [Planctomycetota bacterium]
MSEDSYTPPEHPSAAPGIRWGPFTARIPFVHTRAEWPELVQNLVVAGATGLAVVPIFMSAFGMSFDIAVSLCIVQAVILCSAFFLFGDPFCPGWITPALPLVLAAAMEVDVVSERIAFVTAVVIATGSIFFLLGITRLGALFIRWVPLPLKSGIIFGAGLSAIVGEFSSKGEATPRVLQYPVCITLATGVTLLLLFSQPLEKLKARFGWLAVLGGLGMAPGFILAMVVGPFVSEVSYDKFKALFFDPASGEFIFTIQNLDIEVFLAALPLALAAYVIGFGDIVTGTAILKSASAQRPDEKIDLDEHRTHLSLGIRNLVQAGICGPFFPLQGPLWTGAMVVVTERYRRGREAMRSIFDGISSYYLFGVPLLLFCKPLVLLYQPVLGVALSLTLLLTGFACSYVALAIPRNRVEIGLTVLTGAMIATHSTELGLIVGLVASILLLGKDAWRKEAD